MTEQTSRLAIILDSTGAEKNADNLATALGRMTQAGQNAAAGAGKVKKATEEEADALSSLLDRIDPVNAALNKLDAQQKELAKFKAKGFIDTDTFDTYSKKIEDTRGRLTGFSDSLTKTGMSAKQTAAAMRMVPAQMTDIVVSLAAGQAPLTVLLQQGGQLKDMFGGIAPAAKALGGYVAGLINPFTLAAAAVGVLGYAAYQGQGILSQYNKNLVLTGYAAGQTANNLLYITEQIENAGGSFSKTIKTLSVLASSGANLGDKYGDVANSITNLSSITEESVESLAKVFGKITNDPTSGLKAMAEQYRHVSAAQIIYVQRLQEAGRYTEALSTANGYAAKAVKDMVSEIEPNLGYLETAAKSVGNAFRWMWDGLLNVGKEASLQQQLADATSRLYDLDKALRGGAQGQQRLGLEQARDQARQLVSSLTDQLHAEQRKSEEKQRQAGLDKIALDAQKILEKYTDAGLTAAQKRVKTEQLLKQAIQDNAKAANEGRATLWTNDDIAAARKGIEAMYKDPKEKAYTEDSAQRLIDQIKEQSAAMQAQLGAADKLNSATQQRLKFEAQIDELGKRRNSGGQLTKEQQSILSRSDEILQAYKQQEALQNSVKTLDDYRKMQDDVRSKEQKVNDLLKERLSLLEKAKATGALQPGEYEKTRSNIIQSTKPQLPESVQKVFGANDIGSPASLNNSFISSSSSSLSGYQDDRALSQIEQLKKAMTDYSTFYQQQQDAITQNALLSTQERNDMLVALEQDKNERMKAMNGALYNLQTQTALNSFSSITDSMGTMFGEQSAAYKAAFVTQKAFAIAQAALQLPMAMGQALAGLPFPANLAAMAQVIGLMASITSSISSAAAVGFKTGGYTGNAGVNSVVGAVHGQEYVFDAAATKRIGVSNLEALRNGGSLDATLSRPGYGTGATNVSNSNANTTVFSPSVTVSNSFSGKPDDATLIAINQSNKRLAKQIKDELTAEIIKPQGNFGNALKGYYARGYKE